MNAIKFTSPFKQVRNTMLAACFILAAFNAKAQITHVASGIATTNTSQNNFVSTAIAPNGDLVGAWKIGNNLSVAKWTGSAWSVNTVASTTALGSGWLFQDDIDITVDANGIYHFVFKYIADAACCAQTRGVGYGTFNPTTSTWACQRIEDLPGSPHGAFDPALTLDANGNPEVVWVYSYSGTPRTKAYKHAVKNGGSWTITTRLSTSGDSHGDVATPKIAINASGKRYIVYMANTTQTSLEDKLFVDTDVFGPWTTLLVQGPNATQNFGDPNDIILLNGTTPVVAFGGNGTVSDLNLGTFNGSSWTVSTIDAGIGSNPNPAIATNSSGTMAILYTKKNTVTSKNDIWIAYKTPTGSWTTQLVYGDAGSSMGGWIDFSLSNTGRFVALFHNYVSSAQRDIRYYIGDIAGAAGSSNTAPAISAQTFSVNENSANGTVVGTVVATDADSDTLTYSITAGNTGSVFAINGSTGQITVAGALNHEATASYALTVSANDGTTSSTATVTVNINDVNEAPSISAQTFSIAENSGNNSQVDTVQASDVDGNSLTYSITAGNTGGAFTIDGSTGILVVANSSALDYETTPSFALRVSVTDGSLSDSATVTVNLTDVFEAVTNNAPVMSDATVSVDEDGNIALLSAITANNPNAFADADNDDPQLVKFETLPANGTIYKDGGNAALANTDYSLAEFSLMYYTPNAEYAGTDTFQLNGSDGEDYAAAPATITINIASVNDAPVVQDLVITTNEEQSVKVTDFATPTTYTDIENDPIMGMKIVQLPAHGSLTLFGDAINAGDVVPAHEMEQITYTPGANFSGSDSFIFNVTDGTDFAATNATAHITVVGTNDVPADIAMGTTSVDENAAAGTLVTTLATTDADAGDSHYYQLVASNGDSGNGFFSISGDQLLVANTINYEQNMQLSIRLQTTDQSGESYEKVFTLTVNDKNDAPTAISLSNNTVDEQQPAGAFVGILATADEDGGDTHTLTFVNGAGDADNASFALTNNVLTTNAVLDFNAQQQYSIRVRSTDANGASTEKTFSINALDVNQAPTAITISNASIVENNVLGALVGHFTATDADAGDSHTYTLVNGAGDADNASFQIVNADLEASASFDFETQSSYSIRVRATDVAGESTEEIFTINITDGADAPSAITLSNTSIDENESIGTLVGVFSTVDADQANGHIYALTAGAGDADNGSFTLSNGVLYSATPLNYEAKSSYSIRVRSTDNGGGYVEEAFTIAVNDLNDAPTDVTVTIVGVDENSSIGATAGFLGAIDEDILDTHTFTLAPGFGGADNGKFSILANKLQVNANLDYEAQSSYAVRLRATDNTGAFVEKNVTVTINNVNEAPSGLALSASTIAENEPAGAVIGTFSIADQDHNDSHSYTLATGTGDTDNAAFYISGNMLIANASFNFETQSSFSIRVAGTDMGGLKQEEVFTINITNVADAPMVANITKQIYKNTNTQFGSRDFNTAFSQEEGNRLKHIRITSLPTHGDLLYSNTPVAVGQVILAAEFVALSYSPMLGYLGADDFTFDAYDGVMYSDEATYSLTVIPNRVVGGSVGSINSSSITSLNPVGNTNREGGLTTVEEMPLEVASFGNYPNPFKGATNITFELPVSMSVTLEVYDLVGRKVATLVDGEELDGKQSIQWSGAEAGQYMVRIVATGTNGEVITKTISLVQVK